jgi:hypothetical protein
MNTPPPSIWQHKPWWCQPWSILLTGITIISGSWLVFQRLWITALVAIPILAWMGFFILVYPKAMQSAASDPKSN